MNRSRLLLPLALAGLLACGGGAGGAGSASTLGLAYLDPPASGYRFVRNALLVDDFQKGPGNDRALDGPICRVALDAQPPLAAASIPLSVVQFRYLPAAGSSLTDATANCAVGTLAISPQ